ncbi:MAG: class I SAM-dependent methyltransferase [Bacillota bacterium]
MADNYTRQVYDDWSDEYDAYLGDEQKFRTEAEFFGDLFRKAGAATILDCGCGTGRHAVYLAGMGFKVTGSDLSEGMLKQARERACRHGVEIAFVQSAFEELQAKVAQTFDAILCAGSGIAHLIDDGVLRQGIENIGLSLNPGGVVVFENRNFDQLENKDLVVGPLATGKDKQGSERLYLRVLDFSPRTLKYNLVTLDRASGEWRFHVRSFDLRRNITQDLETLLPQTGLEVLDIFRGCSFGVGDHGTTDIVVARRP